MNSRIKPGNGEAGVRSYEVKVKFDDFSATESESERYFAVVGRYGAESVAHDDGTSSIFIHSEKKLCKTDIAKDLSGLEIISFSEY